MSSPQPAQDAHDERRNRNAGSDDDDDDDDAVTRVEDRGLLRQSDYPDEEDHNEDFLCKPPDKPQNPAKAAFRKLAAVHTRRRNLVIAALATLVAALLLLRPLKMAWLRANGVPPGVYSRNGRLTVGPDTEFFIKGVSWYGMEEHTHLFGGLQKTTIDNVLDFLKRHRFNAIRVPLSIENLAKNPESRIRNIFANMDVKDAPYLELLRHVIQSAAERHILILLDIHRIHNADVQSNGLWYSDDYPEAKLVQSWQTLCREFGNEWNVVGADLKNEPWNSTWNTGDVKTDWKRASEVVGEALHTMCPSWTLFIEGVGTDAGGCPEKCFWSENLAAVQLAPPRVQSRKKVVLSPHVYGPSVFMQEYFKKPGFAEQMPDIWDRHFGRASNKTGLATVIGEWGGTFKGPDAQWQRKFFRYISDKGYGFFYWCLNPESADTGGLLKADWQKPEQEKLDLISTAPSTSVEEYVDHFQYLRNWRTM